MRNVTIVDRVRKTKLLSGDVRVDLVDVRSLLTERKINVEKNLKVPYHARLH